MVLRLYRSASPARRRGRSTERRRDRESAGSASAGVSTHAASMATDTKSPMCGGAVLGKFRRSNTNSNKGNSLQQAAGDEGTQQPKLTTSLLGQEFADFAEPSWVAPIKTNNNSNKNNDDFHANGVSYQSVGGSSVSSSTVGGGGGGGGGGRQSPETTESNTSDEDDMESRDEDHEYILQFEPRLGSEHDQPTTKMMMISGEGNGNTDAQRQLQQNRLQAWVEYQKEKKAAAAEEQAKKNTKQTKNGSSTSNALVQFDARRNPDLWPNYLPAVKEERSFEADDGSTNSGGGDEESNKKQFVAETSGVRSSFSSPERNQMMLAMRGLVMKQQQALAEMSDENKSYREELQECRKLLTLAKEAYTKQKKQVEALSLEKESSDAEVVWLREEVKTLRTEIFKHQTKTTWSSSKSTEEVEERLRRAQAQTPPRRRKELPNMKITTTSPRAVAPKSPSTAPVNKAQPVLKVLSSPRSTTLSSPIASPTNTPRQEHNVLSSPRSSATPKSPLTSPVNRAVSPAPVSSPMVSPIQSPTRDWSLHNMLPSIDYLTDEEDSDDDLVRDVQEFRTSLSGAGVSVKELQKRLEKSTQKKEYSEKRDDGSTLRSPRTRSEQNESRYPDDEPRDEVKPRSPAPLSSIVENNHLRSNLRSPRGSGSPTFLKSSRVPSNSSFSETSASEISSQQRAEVALFKSRLDAIQKKREQRKQIEGQVGSRSSRVRFT